MIQDYRVYEMTKREKLLFYAGGGGAVFAVAMLFFDSPGLSLAAAPLILIFEGQRCDALARRRRDRLASEFVDLLYSLAAAISVGAHMKQALCEARDNLLVMYTGDQSIASQSSYFTLQPVKHRRVHRRTLKPESSLIVSELNEMLCKIENTNQSEKELLFDFAKRSGIEDIKNFVEVYYICRDTGGNLIHAINKSSQMIADKIIVEKDIKVFISQKSFEGKIIAALPLIILMFLRLVSPEYLEPLYQTQSGNILMMMAIICMIIAYKYSEKLTDTSFEQTVESSLPEFLNRISLLLNAGMVVDAVFEKIGCEGENAENKLIRDFSKVYKEAVRSNDSVTKVFRQYAVAQGNREIIRIAGIFVDNMGKGTMISEKIEAQSEMLWHISKKSVEERGKLAETKLSFPMGLMLLVVIVITTAPALMNL